MAAAKVQISLSGVPETMLWTLYYRALGARAGYAGLRDPLAVELVQRLDYPFRERFGVGGPAMTRYQAERQARRVRCFDLEIERFLTRWPAGTVVALGEGLETQFWRVDNGRVRWLSVDLPEATALRERVLPHSPRRESVPGSALDLEWMDMVDPDEGVLVTAQGLLMYLPPPQVRRLIAGCADRLRGGELLFDAVPRWFARAVSAGKVQGRGGFVFPPMPWGMDADESGRIARAHPNITQVRELPWPPPRGRLARALAPAARRLPRLGAQRMSVVAVSFGRTG